MGEKTFQIIGLPRSGTTWIYRLLTKNFPECSGYVKDAQKHAMPDKHRTIDRVDIVMLIRKSLDNWLWSVDRYPTSELRRRSRYNVVTGGSLNREAAAELYHQFYGAWESSGRQIEYVRYESVLDDTVGWLSGISDKYGFPHNGEWDVIETGHLWDPARKERYLAHA